MSTDNTSPAKVIVVATAALAGAWALVSTYRRQHRLPLPPGPPEKSWLAGNAEDILALFQWVKFTEWANKYGDIIHLRIHAETLIVLSSYESIVDLFEKRGQIYSDRPVRTMPFLMGWRDIISFRDNDARFKAFRRHVNIGFSKKAAINYHAGQTKGVHVFLQRLLNNPDNLILELNRFAASFIMEATYGYSIVSDNDPYIMASDEAFKSLMTGSRGDYLVDSYPFLQHLPSWLPGMGFKRMAQEARKFPMRMAMEPFEWTKAQMSKGKAAPSLVRRLLEESENGPVDEEAIMWTAATMYAGGVHTTVTTLCNFIAAMMLHPHVAHKAREEIDRVVGTERLPTMSDRNDLPYLECVLSEILRWQPPTSMEVPHRVKQDDEYRGYRIPANSTIRCNIYAITRDERMFPDPEKFVPERFDQSNQGPMPLKPHDFMFGVGRRICPGKDVVDASLYLIMANILAAIDINRPRDEAGCEYEPEIKRSGYSINQVLPFKCSITPRSEHVVKLINSVVMFGEE
ncbi:cytochrome P450 family protein [Rhizoctonia solani AG-3 Rhs1AP]|uniref:Cytochrome P450 family protein n=2 Tax=Rhizoctonia solani AG-3 TaxID=1086053 RepID=A0A074RQZ9_9AGAM|nr:cytochrome P450 family protein [Rhizoctonia solani AG-3 Rhs1AP]KEP49269.1 cytochrome P450 family protein [Rhizoctonia solani 123E]